jgi:hypothetical protein
VLGFESASTALANPGDTTIAIADCTSFNTGGVDPGINFLEVNGQFITWTGSSVASGAGNIIGIPATGFGSIQSPIASGTLIRNANYIAGLVDPATALVTTLQDALQKGTEVVVSLVVDDAGAQATQGVKATLIQDGRLSYAGMVARAAAELANFKAPIKGSPFTTRDPRAKVGKTIAVSLSAPTSFSGTFAIRATRVYGFDQRGPVNAHNRHAFPIIDVTEAAPAGFIDAIDLLSNGDDSR